MVPIDKHPKIVEKKNHIENFEIDTVIELNHVGALITVVDRKSKFKLIKKVISKYAKEVTKALIDIWTNKHTNTLVQQYLPKKVILHKYRRKKW